MDVVLTPTGTAGDAWSLKDRLGRSLGTIVKHKDPESFQITAEPEGTLQTVQSAHPSLQDAMSTIARTANGACSLDSQD